VQVIQTAREHVDLNVYYLSSRSILSVLSEAVHRGVRVRIILDEKPYGMPQSSVRREFEQAKATGATVRAAPARFEMSRSAHRYVFDHAKYVCNGHQCEIGSANYDWSAFHRNREYLWVSRDPNIVNAAENVFNADWRGAQAPAQVRTWLVLSPGAKQPILTMISQPGAVEIESEEMGSDRPILQALEAKGSTARVILPSTISSQDRRNAEALVRHGVQVRLMPKATVYIHAKIILGNQWSFLGSQNFSASSLNENREMGVVLAGPATVAARQQFAQDWSAAQPLAAVSDTQRRKRWHRMSHG